MQNFMLYEGGLDIEAIYKLWYEYAKGKNCGALLSFCGIVREDFHEENSKLVEGLSFDIYEPILEKWFEKWQNEVKTLGVHLFFAHSVGVVKIHQSSYFAGILSKNRKIGLKLLNDFVEDFKKNAPIWKYDVIEGEKIYAKTRSSKLEGAGILAGD